jgi:hypothetical protein
MSAPITLPNSVKKLGPGSLTFGATGDLHNVSCLVNGVTLSPDKDADDAVVKLCGTTRPGEVRYTWTLAGNVDLDLMDATGFYHLTVTAPGTVVPFTFKPANDGPTVTGTVRLDPLPLGGDEAGKLITADFEFDVIGDPAYSWTGVTVPAGPTF